jgi:hypothetical protein
VSEQKRAARQREGCLSFEAALARGRRDSASAPRQQQGGFAGYCTDVRLSHPENLSPRQEGWFAGYWASALPPQQEGTFTPVPL